MVAAPIQDFEKIQRWVRGNDQCYWIKGERQTFYFDPLLKLGSRSRVRRTTTRLTIGANDTIDRTRPTLGPKVLTLMANSLRLWVY